MSEGRDNVQLQHWVNMIWLILLGLFFGWQVAQNQKLQEQLGALRLELFEIRHQISKGGKP